VVADENALRPADRSEAAASARPAETYGRRRGAPLRVLAPRFLGGVRGLLGFVGRFGLVLALTGAVLVVPAPPGLGLQGQRGFAAFVFTAAILALEPVALPIAALMVPVALVALGVADTTQAFETYSRPVVFLILGSLFLAEALRKHGLTRRLALATLVASRGRTRRLLLGLMALSAGLSMWIENTATAAMLIPVAITIAKQVEDRERARRLLVLLILGIAYAASLGGMATIMGSSSNAVASSYLAQVRVWTFVDWMTYGVPSLALLFPLTWWLLLRLVPPSVDALDVAPVRAQLTEMGPMSRTEKEVLGVLGFAALLWIGGPFFEHALDLPPTLLSAAMVAVMAVSYLAVRQILDWDDLRGVSWGIFFIIGAGLALGEALGRSGATGWLAGLIGPFVSGAPLALTLLVLVLASALLTNLLNNTTVAAVFVPILLHLATNDSGLGALGLVLPVTLATTFGYSLPSASGRMALIAATGIVRRGEMLRYGLVVTAASSALLAMFFYLLTLAGWI
jgi:solute carrier family 13 (sodium-dependent dicarboxylate transporter), member 2/3/5